MSRKSDTRIEKAKVLYLSGMKLIEIARELGLPEGTLRSWKNRYKWDCNVANNRCNTANKIQHRKKATSGIWNDAYFNQLESFPESKFKDMVDASSSAFNEIENGATYSIPSMNDNLSKSSYWR